MTHLARLTWPLAEVGFALAALAKGSGLVAQPAAPPKLPEPTAGTLDDVIVEAARCMRLSAQAVDARYDEVEQLVGSCAPAILRLDVEGDTRLLLVARTGRRRVKVVAPDRSLVEVSCDELCALLRAPLEATLPKSIENVLAHATTPRARARTRAVIMSYAYAADPRLAVRACWMLRIPESASLFDQVVRAKIPSWSILFVLTLVWAYALDLLGWQLVGRGALEGRFDRAWIAAWALVLATWIPVVAVSLVILGRLVLSFRIVLRRRLLEGSFKLRPEEIRREGVGQLLGRIIDTEEFQQLGLNALSPAMMSLVAAVVVLGMGVSGWLFVTLLLGWIAFSVALGTRLYAETLRWTHDRLAMTHHLVECMAGHRTRLAQLPKGNWHDDEEAFLTSYIASYEKRDRRIATFRAVIPRGWIAIGLLGLAPGLITGAYQPVGLAITLGGIVLALRALTLITQVVEHIANIAVAWTTSGHLMRAAERKGTEPLSPILPPPEQDPRRPRSRVVLQASGITFGHRPGQPVLRGCSFEVDEGDRILVEGPSGGGKSTLVQLLGGLHRQEDGLLLADGYDVATLGLRGWRRHVGMAPQFHENHVFHGQLAFNLLLGRRWPPTQEDLAEAEEICFELGLGPLLAKMPCGLTQTIGDTGWQLSHGERSRLYIARALLQKSKVILFDESFAALDPDTLRTCLECALRRAPALIVVAHP